jgi:diacylglycerol kinase (ATP)
MQDRPTTPPPEPEPRSAYKTPSGLGRLLPATRYSLAGLRAAFRSEAAFRQELALGGLMLLSLPWLAPGRVQALLMAGSVVAVWVVELLNSAIEAVADAHTLEHDPVIGRAKDIGSAAVFLSLLFAGTVWVVLLWP